MKYVILISLLLVGCSDDGLLGVIKSFEDQCQSKMKAEFHYNSWSRGVVFHCDDFIGDYHEH